MISYCSCCFKTYKKIPTCNCFAVSGGRQKSQKDEYRTVKDNPKLTKNKKDKNS